MSKKKSNIITANELRKLIASLEESNRILSMKKDNEAGYNATSIKCTPIYVREMAEESSPPTL